MMLVMLYHNTSLLPVRTYKIPYGDAIWLNAIANLASRHRHVDNGIIPRNHSAYRFRKKSNAGRNIANNDHIASDK
jgi:hypothetical protein